MAGTAQFNAVMEAARNCIRAKTVHQRYTCVQALDRAVKAYDQVANVAIKVDQMRERKVVVSAA